MSSVTDRALAERVLDGLTDFVRREVAPLEDANADLFSDHRVRYDDAGRERPEVLGLRQEVRQRSSKAGYYTMFVPEELGGAGQGPLLHFLAWERLYHAFGPKATLPFDALAHWARGPSYIFRSASDHIRNNVLPALLSGEKSMCFALSEPEAGSDAWNLSTKATLAEDGWKLTGTKQWTTNGPVADYALVFAVTDRIAVRARAGGISAFFLETSSAGFHVDSVIKLFGSIGGDEAIISLDDVCVPHNSLVGSLHGGFDVALEGITLGRMFNAGRAIGLSRWALEKACAYAAERRTFGNPIANYQAVQFMLADAAIDIYGSRTMAVDCASKIESGATARKELAMVKACSTEASFRALDRCIQVFGGMGFTNELGLYEAWHTARLSRVVDGSAEMMRRTIAKQLLRGDLDF
jgi:acyl-CoA dehydrogenase